MSDKTLVILTHYFPVKPGEEFLIDELDVISSYFDKILVCPVNSRVGAKSIHRIPVNVKVCFLEDPTTLGKPFRFYTNLIKILLKEFIRVPNKGLFFSTLKFNLSLLKQCWLKAQSLNNLIKSPDKTILYSYWCDDLAMIASFAKLNSPALHFISRAHGFDVFEEQSDVKHIFFRPFQLALINRLYAVSIVGSNHLKQQNKRYIEKITCSYLGIKSNGKLYFEDTTTIRLVTCSRIRSIKRLNLLVEALKLIRNKAIEWDVIGDGEDLEKLKELSKQLPENIKVNFKGYMNSEAIHQLYATHHYDFLVSLSSSEGLPVSMMEAISHGIPVLSTDVGGCKEIVTSATGKLIQSNFTSETLSELISTCKESKFNQLFQREVIKKFWEANFNSISNYQGFANGLLHLKIS